VRGFVVNRFRGDRTLLEPGLRTLKALTGRPTLGVLPYVDDLWVDEEDRPDPSAYRDPGAPLGDEILRIAVVRLPRSSNLTDFDPLAAEPGVAVRFAARPQEIADADLVVLPGTRATVEDLAWMRGRGIDLALAHRAEADRPILGICGGYQMLGTAIDDRVESGFGKVDGLELLPVETTFDPHKVLGRRRRELADGGTVTGYEIRHGSVRRVGGAPFFADEGCQAGSVAGTSWHGLFENDDFRRSYLTEVGRRAGRAFVASPTSCFAAVREARFETLADLVADHLDTVALMKIIEGRSDSPATLAISSTNEAELTSAGSPTSHRSRH
jgi:adenosylcobyric acid synthase